MIGVARILERFLSVRYSDGFFRLVSHFNFFPRNIYTCTHDRSFDIGRRCIVDDPTVDCLPQRLHSGSLYLRLLM